MIRERLSPLDILMVLICSGILAYQSDYPAIGLAIGLVWIIPFLLVKPSSYRRLPYRMDGKRMLYAFLAAFVVQMALHFVQLTIMGQREVTQLGVSQLVLTLPIFLCYFFGVKLSDLNWGMTWKELLFVGIMFILLREIPVHIAIGKGKELFSAIMSLPFLKSLLIHFLYPSIAEEVVFRGFLLTGLIHFGFREDASNIIQAIIFGLIHITGKGDLSFALVLSCTIQIYLGFIFGKIYLDTKSLMPCMVLHTLFNTFSGVRL